MAAGRGEPRLSHLAEERLSRLRLHSEAPPRRVQVLTHRVRVAARDLAPRGAADPAALEVESLVDLARGGEDVGGDDEVHLADAGQVEAVRAENAGQQRARVPLDVSEVRGERAAERSQLAVRDGLDQVEAVVGKVEEGTRLALGEMLGERAELAHH